MLNRTASYTILILMVFHLLTHHQQNDPLTVLYLGIFASAAWDYLKRPLA